MFPKTSVLLCILAATVAVEAQETKPPQGSEADDAAKRAAAADVQKGQRTLYMVAKSEPDQTIARIKRVMNMAKEKAEGRFSWLGDCEPQAIDAETFDLLDALIRKGQVLETLRRKPGAVSVEQFSRSDEWVIRLGGPFHVLRELQLKYEDGSSDVLKAATGDRRDGQPLRFHSPGIYVVNVKKANGKTPTSFEATVFEGDREVQPRPQGQWPKPLLYWLIRFQSFEGQFGALKAVLEDENKMPNPFSNVALAAKAEFSIGTLFEDTPLPDPDEFDGFFVTMRFGAPSRRKPKRVWMLWPVFAENLEAERQRWLGMTEDTLSAEIRKPGSQAVMFDPRSEPTELSPDGGPKWYEIPPAPDGRPGFERKFKVANLEGWRAKGDKAPWRFEGWEFGDIQFIKVMHPSGGRKVLLVDREREKWPTSIRKMQNAEKGGSAPRKTGN